MDQLVEAPSHKRTTYGTGLLKGLAITMRHLLSRSVTVHYPSEKDVLPARSRGVIALKTENCTVCMLCARECPDWCIYIEGHKESRQPAVEGKRAKKFNVLDRFAIDYALCMYCGICVEVCPYDALFWSPEYEYAEHDIVELTHEIDRLNGWMYKVLPPVPLDDGAMGPEFKVAAPPAPVAVSTPVAEVAPVLETASAAVETATGVSDVEAAAVRTKVYEEEMAKGSDPRVAEGRAKAAEMRARKGTKGPS